MNEIIKSISERGKIKATIYNVRINLKDIRSYEKMLSSPVLAQGMDIFKTRSKIQSLINEAAINLQSIEGLCKTYSELWESEFNEIKTALHKIAKSQPLTKMN